MVSEGCWHGKGNAKDLVIFRMKIRLLRMN